MRSTHPLKQSAWLAAALLVPALWAPARAQTTGTMSTDSGTCEGMIGMTTIAGKTFVSVEQVPITSMSGYVYNRAECECKTRELGMRIEMSTPIAMGTSGVGAELWVGTTDCAVQLNRTMDNARCEQVSTPISVSSFMSIGAIDLAVPSEAIADPNKARGKSSYSCNVSGDSTSTLFVLLGDLTSTPATCKMPLKIDTTPPAAPKNVSAANGDGAVKILWEAPTGENSQDIDSYQVLCRRKDQPLVPVRSADFRQSLRYYYSACIDGSMYRRPPPTQTTNTPTAPSTGIPKTLPGVFSLHPAFVCSDRVQVGAGGTSFNTRITDLENGVPYEFLVVAIDRSGNPSVPPGFDCRECDVGETAAACKVRRNRPECPQIVEATPAPVVNPLSQFCQTEQDCPAGFGCAVSPNRRGLLAETAALAMLGLSTALLSYRWRRRRSTAPSLPRRPA